MQDLQELDVHSNMDTRCERREPQPEGIDQQKLDLIYNIRGITWEKVYEILFPGAPVPSPCKLYQILSGEYSNWSNSTRQTLKHRFDWAKRPPRLRQSLRNLRSLGNTTLERFPD